MKNILHFITLYDLNGLKRILESKGKKNVAVKDASRFRDRLYKQAQGLDHKVSPMAWVDQMAKEYISS